MLLDEEALVLAGEVHTPAYGELKLVTVGDSLFEYLDTLGVRQTHKLFGHNRMEALQESLVYHLVEELEVVLAVLERPVDAVLDEVFLEVHQVGEVDERHLGLYHPELSQVAWSIGVFGTEGGAEGVDRTQGSGTELTLELSAHGE